MTRKPIQIATINESNQFDAELIALCDDGTIWHMCNSRLSAIANGFR